MISNSSKLSSEDITKSIFESTNSVDAAPDFRSTDNKKRSNNVKENTLPVKISDDGSDNILSDISDDIEMLKKEKKKKEKKEKKKEKRDKKKKRKRSISPGDGKDDDEHKKSKKSKNSTRNSDDEYEVKHKKKRTPEEEEEHRKRKAERKEKKRIKKEREKGKEKIRERENRKRRKRSRSPTKSRSRSYSSSSYERDESLKRTSYNKKFTEKKQEPFLKRRATVTAYQVEAANGSKFNINKCEWLSELTGATKRLSPQKNSKFKRNFNKTKVFKKQQYSPPREVIDKQALLEKAKINAAKLALKGELKREDVMIHTGGKSLETYIEQASSVTENTVMTSLGPLILPKAQQSKRETIDVTKNMGIEAISDESEDEDAKWEKIEKVKAKTKSDEEEEHHMEIKKVPSSNALKFNISNFRAVPTKTVEERLLDEHKTKECLNLQNNLLNKWVPVNINQPETTSKIRYSVNNLNSTKQKQIGLAKNYDNTISQFDDLDLPPPPAPPTIAIPKSDDFDLPPPPIPPLVSAPNIPTSIHNDYLPPPPLPPLPPPKTMVDMENIKNTMSVQKFISMKADADKKLRQNPFDKEALQTLRDAEEFMKLWGAKTLLR
uniref:Uncharacterized protein n=1 Tax=Parastrongyloides trichosuri TaxID=131310 RepID=A0A0N4ZVF0_PARTI